MRLAALWFAVVVGVAVLHANEPAQRNRSPEPVSWVGLDNVFRLSPLVVSGSQPRTDEAFAALAGAGITTVVSVDGARPMVDLAKAHGLRYIHIPIGYDGFSHEAELALVRVVREAEGPIYIHCHHGKHRGPAAAAVACLAEGSVDRNGAARILEVAGTGENYRGLWRDVAKFQMPAADQPLPELVEIAEVGHLAEAMIAVDTALAHLNQLSDNNWRQLPKHPDLAADQEALLLWEALRESQRASNHDDQSAVAAELAMVVAEADRLRTFIAAREFASSAHSLEAISGTCQACHARHRDNR